MCDRQDLWIASVLIFIELRADLTMAARVAAAAALCAAAASAQSTNCSAAAPSFYVASNSALLLNGTVLSWSSFAGRVLALTNVASF